jgi:hypothetical protein
LFSRLRVPDDVLQLNGRNSPFVNTVRYLDAIFDRRTTWVLHIERTAAKALVMHIRTYSLVKSERVSISKKSVLYKDLIRSITVCACLTWDYAADAKLLKLQRLQHRFLRAIPNFDRRTPVHKVQMAVKIPYVYDLTSKLCRKQTEVIQTHLNPNISAIGQG